jgi:hypothetical protein
MRPEVCHNLDVRNRFSPMIFAVGYALVVPLVVALGALWRPVTHLGFARIRAWQTLEAGLLAIAAALITAYFVHRQTLESRRQENERVSRQHAAARAVLPLALSSIVGYCNAVATSLSWVPPTSPGFRAVRVPPLPYNPPEFDPGAIASLQEVIESSNETIGDRLASIISEVQILASRLRTYVTNLSRPGMAGLKFNAVEYVINASTIHARTQALFKYGRRETNDAPPLVLTEDELISSLNLLGFDEDTEPEIYRTARERAARWARQVQIDSREALTDRRCLLRLAGYAGICRDTVG